MARFLASIDLDIPWHLSRFHPDYKYSGSQATPVSTLRLARDIGREAGLNYIYMGNIWGEGEDTVCPGCGALLIKREGFTVRQNRIKAGCCPDCGRPIAGVFE